MGVPWPSFPSRLDADAARYGTRADEAQRNHGVDYKALSHALRALDQMEELFDTGKIVFPRPQGEKLVRVSEAKYPGPSLSKLSRQASAEVDAKRANALYVGVYDEGFAKKSCLTVMDAEKGGTIRRRGGRNQKNFLRWSMVTM